MSEPEVKDLNKDGEEEKGLTQKLGLSFKVDNQKDFTNIKEGDTVLIDTPIEGAKTGTVKNREETWSGVVQASVDTGANQYTVTPFADEFSAEYRGVVDDSTDLTQDILDGLQPASVETVGENDVVLLDCPQLGATRGTVTDVVESANQGTRVTLKAGDDHFVVYEEPTPIQTKEQAYIVGQLDE